uniref:Uncharacterized protein n=1 Tax=Acrobeloides nanus TaxID=290746 RepID=A0A914CBP9_9BILA
MLSSTESRAVAEQNRNRDGACPKKRERVLPYVCRHQDCDPNKEFACRSFYSHNKIFHFFDYKCQTCGMNVYHADKNVHIDANPEQIVNFPWCWKPFIIPSMNIRCPCAEKLSLPDECLCVLDMKKIQCVFFEDLAEIYALSMMR